MSPQETLRQYEERINRHDFDRLLSLIAFDAIFWFNDGSYSGIDEIRAAFERTWQNLANDTYWLDNVLWIARGDTAASCIYQFHWKTVVDGVEHAGAGRGTTVLRFDGERWLIAHEHLSRFPT